MGYQRIITVVTIGVVVVYAIMIVHSLSSVILFLCLTAWGVVFPLLSSVFFPSLPVVLVVSFLFITFSLGLQEYKRGLRRPYIVSHSSLSIFVFFVLRV